MKVGNHLRRPAPAASAGAHADASRRGKGSKSGSAYLYFELAPPDGRAKVQIRSRKLSDRPARGSASVSRRDGRGHQSWQQSCAVRVRISSLHLLTAACTSRPYSGRVLTVPRGTASRSRVEPRGTLRKNCGTGLELRAAVGRCELEIKICRSTFSAFPTSRRVSVRGRGRRGGWTPEMGTRLRR